MALGVLINHWDPEPWLRRFREVLGEDQVFVYPDIPDHVIIDFLACWRPLPGDLLRYQDLHVLQSLGAGVDHLFRLEDLPSDAQITRIVDHDLTHDMWEYLLGFILADMKHLFTYDSGRTQGLWERLPYRRMRETHIGVLGLGELGGYSARRFADTGFNAMGWARSEKSIKGVTCLHGVNGLKTLCTQSDYVINLLPLTPQTESILDINLFRQMQNHATIINVGRGAHMVEQDLLDALDQGLIRSAILDVFRVEPLPAEHAFWSHPQIYMTPHIASMSNPDTAMEQVLENYRRFRESKPLLHTVSIDRGY